jgi:NADPH-dependent glutamate synthase beta subunit-like oxidoreductase
MARSNDLGLAVRSNGRQPILPYTAIQTGRDSLAMLAAGRTSTDIARTFRVHRATASRVASDTRRNRPVARIAMKKLTLS